MTYTMIAAAAAEQQSGLATDPEKARSRLTTINAALELAWNKQWLSRPPLEPQLLLQRAQHKTALSDFGPDNGWRRRLDLLTNALDREASLTPLGQTIAHGQLVSALANRLRATALWKRYPAILEQPLRAPIIIVGQMRSGSTRMQRLLACDPRLTFTRFYEGWNPLPSVALGGRFDDRRLRGWMALRFAHALNPQFKVVHPTRTNVADEEIGLHNVSVFGSAFEAQWRVPSFAADGEVSDTQEIYWEFKRLLQTILWLRREPAGRPYVMKVPQFTQDLASVLSVFPDARLVCLQRNHADVIASSASLVHNQMALQSSHVDPHWIGREWLNKVALRHRRTQAVCAATYVPQADVSFSAMQEDWRPEIYKVYRMLGLPLLPHVKARMQRYLDQAARARARLAKHSYTLADFGICHGDVQRAFGNAQHSCEAHVPR